MSDALTTKARIKDRLKITETGFDDLFDRLIVATTKRMSQMCNRRFLQATYTRELYDGCSVTGSRISTLLVKNAPVHSITTIEYKTGLNSDPTWTAFDEDDYDVDMKYGILYFKFLLPSGKQNIRITYNAGWSGNSIGIADGWRRDISGADLLNRADKALYQVKASGKNALRFADDYPAIEAGGDDLIAA